MNFLHLSAQLSLSEEKLFSSLAVYKHDTFKNQNNTILRKEWRLAFFFFFFFETFYTDSDADFISTYFILYASCESLKSVLKLRNEICRLEKIVQAKMTIKIIHNVKSFPIFNEVNLP